MPTVYTIYDILFKEEEKRPYFFGTFEDTPNPDIEWPHRHDYYSVIYFTHGTGINVIDFTEYEIKPQRIFMMYPGQIHNWSYAKDTKGYILLLDKYYQHFDNNNTSYVDVSQEYERLVKLFFKYQITEYKKNDLLTEESMAHGITFFNSLLKRIISENSNHSNPLTTEVIDFITLISEHINENLSIQFYSDQLHLTVDKLNECCKLSMGTTAKQIILDQKITEAKRLLYFTDHSVKEISYQLGFEDSSYFARIFKDKTFSSPKFFREKVLKNPKKVL